MSVSLPIWLDYKAWGVAGGLLLTAIFPFLLGIFTWIPALHSRRDTRRVCFGSLGGMGVFMLLDGIALLGLPLWGVSFGPPEFTWFSFGWIRLFCLGAWGAVWLFWISSPRLSSWSSARNGLAVFGLLNLALWLGLLYGTYLEPQQVGVSRLNLPDQPVPGSSAVLRVVQLSDLHVERLTRRERETVQLVQDLKPDLIVLTGDYLNLSYLQDAQALADARQVLSQLHAPYGIYAVNGTVDDRAHMQALFSDLPVTVLDDELARIETGGQELAILGVHHSIDSERDGRALERLTASVPAGAYRILLYHTPDLIEVAARQRINLYFAGHTHGGQVRLPWYGALVTFSDYGKRFEMGHYQVQATDLYVSRGLGLEGAFAPRVRFLSPPEIVAVDLHLAP